MTLLVIVKGSTIHVKKKNWLLFSISLDTMVLLGTEGLWTDTPVSQDLAAKNLHTAEKNEEEERCFH